MTTYQMQIVLESWAKVVSQAGAISDMFYDKLFELDPSLRVLFPTDMAEQKKMLLVVLTSAIIGLGDLDRLTPTIQDLGKRHHGYGVLQTHYETVGEALLGALKQHSGNAWNRETEGAWVAVYGILSGLMIDGAKSEAV
jgi:hemoglobin-like flavoprotein